MRRSDGIEIDPAKIAYFRDLRALSRAGLSARSGIPYRVLAYYEAGARRPRARNFRRLYTALGCGPEDLLRARHGRGHLIDRSEPGEGAVTVQRQYYTLCMLCDQAFSDFSDDLATARKNRRHHLKWHQGQERLKAGT